VVAVAAVVVLVRNAIDAVRSATLLVRAPRRPEAAQQQATGVVGEEEETSVVLGGAVKKHGALCRVALPEKGTKCFVFSIYFKLHVRWGRPSVA